MSAPSEPIPTYSSGDIAWVMVSTSLIFLMIPGVGYFYSGLARSKNALSLIMLSCLSVAVVVVQWFIWGYSLCFGKSGNPFIGNLDHAFLRDVMDGPSIGSPKIPDLAFMIYQCMFAAIAPALAVGASAERARILPTIVFIFIWSTLVYDPIVYWTWSPDGWLMKLGNLDFAGGTPIEICSGVAALAYAVKVGKRQGHGTDEFKAHNMSNVVLGTAFLWFGWFGFNGGSALTGSMRAVMAIVVTNISASAGALSWVIIDYFRTGRKFSAFAFCSGAVAGLVAITPASGFVGPAPALLIGVCAGTACNYARHLNHLFNFDDALDVFAVHAVGGILGNILTGIFAEQRIAALDGTVIAGGWLNGHFIQVAYQLAASAAGFAWTFVVTYIILWVMDRIPGLSLRTDAESERLGLDLTELGESAYHHVECTIASNNPSKATVTEITVDSINREKETNLHWNAS
ncbi:ammonium transporter [Basidiobolus meristosporus CBS 931.73]|uniref:Ammonium transporter n=1 Tax=Basidiobolus meristosporus CBS 931.73 TaxID=1314790 RepID=A0A1Y1XUL0_9FUNG|nr:ammonium transporter [Basidiobolus meristosporus CBS 931.73]|eukprot:ORX89430.1 ammonium transporter [Basidiobolus meristosporus CBS 931.73]